MPKHTPKESMKKKMMMKEKDMKKKMMMSEKDMMMKTKSKKRKK